MSYNLKVLIVEDQPADAELVQYEMRRAGIEFTARCVETQESFQQALADFQPDLILSDFTMPSFDGVTALGLARALTPDTPFIFVSGTIGEDRALDALKSGATDYVLKDRPKRVISAIQRALIEAKEHAARRDSQQALEASEKRLRSFMRHMPAQAAILDLQGRYEFVNESWERATGKTAPEVLGSTCEEVLPPANAASVGASLCEVAETGRPVSRIFQSGEGVSARWWCLHCFPVPDAQGNVVSIGTVALDVTERGRGGPDPVDSRGPGRAL